MLKFSKDINDEYYTPLYVFEALGIIFDLDVSCPDDPSVKINTPCLNRITKKEDGIKQIWRGCIWMNPPYGNEKNKNVWLDKFFKHGNGVALMPDRTSTKWWQKAAKLSDCFLQVEGKIKFIKEDGNIAGQPSNGTTLFAIGEEGVRALKNAQTKGLGLVFKKL